MEIYISFNSIEVIALSDLIILLDGDVDVIYERKREISRDKILEYWSLYKSYFTKRRLAYIVIDSTVNDVDQVAHLAIQELEKVIYE